MFPKRPISAASVNTFDVSGPGASRLRKVHALVMASFDARNTTVLERSGQGHSSRIDASLDSHAAEWSPRGFVSRAVVKLNGLDNRRCPGWAQPQLAGNSCPFDTVIS